MASDKFPNLLSGRVTLSAADTITFLELQTGAALGLNLGLLIDRIDYFPTIATINLIVDDADLLVMGIATANSHTDSSILTDARILTVKRLLGQAAGTPANLLIHEQPLVERYDPPLIVAAPKLFLFGASSSLGAAAVFDARIYFRYIKLTTQEYLELAEANLLLG